MAGIYEVMKVGDKGIQARMAQVRIVGNKAPHPSTSELYQNKWTGNQICTIKEASNVLFHSRPPMSVTSLDGSVSNSSVTI